MDIGPSSEAPNWIKVTSIPSGVARAEHDVVEVSVSEGVRLTKILLSDASTRRSREKLLSRQPSYQVSYTVACVPNFRRPTPSYGYRARSHAARRCGVRVGDGLENFVRLLRF